jgi:hypothetical protein
VKAGRVALLLLLAGCKERPGGSGPVGSVAALSGPAGSPPLLAVSSPPGGSAAGLAASGPRRAGGLLVGRCEQLDTPGKPLPPATKRSPLLEAARRASLDYWKLPAAGAEGGLAPGKPLTYCQLSQDVLPGVDLLVAGATVYNDILGDSGKVALLAVTGGQGRAVLLRHEGHDARDQTEGRWRRLASCPPALGRRADPAGPACTNLTGDFVRRAAELLAAPALDREAIESFALLLAAIEAQAPLARVLGPEEMADRDLDEPPRPPPAITPEGALVYVETATDPLRDRSLIAVRLEPSPKPLRITTSRIKSIPPPFDLVPEGGLGQLDPGAARRVVERPSVKAAVRVVSGEPDAMPEIQQTGSITAAVRNCYRDSLGSQPGATGTIELTARLDRSGRMSAPAATTTGSLPPGVVACAAKALSDRSFAAPRVAPLELALTLRLRTHEPWPDFPR